MLLRQVCHVCVEIDHIINAFEVDNIGPVNDVSSALEGSFNIVEPLRIILLEKLIKASFRRQHIFLEVESSKAKDLIEEAFFPIETGDINLEFFLFF